MPFWTLPEMTLPASGVPTVLPDALLISTPCVLLAIAIMPLPLVPMKLLATRLPVAAARN